MQCQHILLCNKVFFYKAQRSIPIAILVSVKWDHRLIQLYDPADTEGGASKADNRKYVTQESQSQLCDAPVQGIRRSQRQQQQRQLRDKQLLAETHHTARIRTTTVVDGTPSDISQVSRTTPCTVHTASNTRESCADVAVLCSTKNHPQGQKQQLKPQRQRGPAQSSPTAGVKKQISPVGKGMVGGLALGGRLPLRVRRNTEQSSMKGELNSKFAQSHGLGNIFPRA